MDNYTIVEHEYGQQSGFENAEKRLIIIDVFGKVQEINLDQFHKTRLLMGRLPENDIVINALVVSGVHGKFKIDGNRLLYADLNSKNGTIVDTLKRLTYIADVGIKDGVIKRIGSISGENEIDCTGSGQVGLDSVHKQPHRGRLDTLSYFGVKNKDWQGLE